MFGRGKSSNYGSTRELRRVLGDFAVALVLFWAVALSVSGDHSRAHAVPLPAIGMEILRLDAATPAQTSVRTGESRPAAQSFHRAEAVREQALLSLAFAAIVACNLAFWRHLRRVYASPRRSVWRRG